jgi:hypothetical protein
MPKRVIAIVAGLAAVGFMLGSEIRAQESRTAQQEVSASTCCRCLGVEMNKSFRHGVS